jgi:BASS family bile acid:Na+ symporter
VGNKNAGFATQDGFFMTAAKAVILALQSSIFLTVFSLGLRATFQDAASLLGRPRLLLRSLISMNVIMPLLAASLAGAFSLYPAVRAALVLLAVSPVPPMLPRQQLKRGGSSWYVCGLLATTSLLAIVTVPVSIAVLARLFHQNAGISSTAVAKVVSATVLLPLGLGMLVHKLAPGFAQRRAGLMYKAGLAMLVLLAVPLLFVSGESMLALLGRGTLVALAAFVAAGVAVGHWLGGPDPPNRNVLALATASRHPGLAIAIATANFPAQRRLIAAAILLYLVVKAFVLIPYNYWSKRRIAESVLPTEKPGQRAA